MESANRKKNTSRLLQTHPLENCSDCEKVGAANCVCALWDKALIVLLETEESLLGGIIEQCTDLVNVAEQQALEMRESLPHED